MSEGQSKSHDAANGGNLRECAWCSGAFSPHRRSHIYCSYACGLKMWVFVNPERRYQLTREWRERNPQHVARIGRAAYARNPEAGREKSRRWRAAHPEYPRLRHAGRNNSQPADRLLDWRGAIARLARVCAYCGAADVPLTIDHVVPLSRGGAHVPENVVLACGSCNSRKGARDELEFRALLALEALIEGRRGAIEECASPYRLTRPCRIPRHAPVPIRDTDVGSCDVRWALTA